VAMIFGNLTEPQALTPTKITPSPSPTFVFFIPPDNLNNCGINNTPSLTLRTNPVN